jgi:hypothetical protein
MNVSRHFASSTRLAIPASLCYVPGHPPPHKSGRDEVPCCSGRRVRQAVQSIEDEAAVRDWYQRADSSSGNITPKVHSLYSENSRLQTRGG